MDNIFDSLKVNVFNTVSKTMGYEADWYPDGNLNSDPIKGPVLLNVPTNPDRQAEVEYQPFGTRIEYKESDFPGLYEKALQKERTLIVIKGVHYEPFNATAPEKIARDGGVIELRLQIINIDGL